LCLQVPRRGTAQSHSAWRSAVATGVASAALLAYGARPTRAQSVPPLPNCSQISGGGTTVTCSGDLSTGVSSNSQAYSVLNVNHLTTNITPDPTVYGIQFGRNGSVEANIDTGPFSIITTSDFTPGILIGSSGYPDPLGGPVTVNATANISTSGVGSPGLVAGASNPNGVQVTATGVITTGGRDSTGIAAGSQKGSIDIRSSATTICSRLSRPVSAASARQFSACSTR
jgi:hypothetical protein